MCRIYFNLIFVLVVLFSTVGSLFAQHDVDYRNYARITGRIVDAATGEPLPAVQINNVYRHLRKDSIVVRIYTADVDGKFNILVPRVEHNRIELVCLGYKFFEKSLIEIPIPKVGTVFEQSTLSRPVDLGDLKMVADVQQLDEVVVRSRIRLYEMRGDTAIIFPRLVKVGKGEPIIELLRRHPMFTVTEDGDVYFDGKRIERVKLNEKLLFGEDARAAVQTLQAEDAHLIKAYDEVDEKDEIVKGTEHARRRKVLDIVSFRNFDEIQDVEIALEGGVDKEKGVNGERQERYFAGVTGGLYSDRTRISLKALLDNCPGGLKFGKFQRLGSNNLYQRTGEGEIKMEKSRSDLLNQFSVQYNYKNTYTNDQQESVNDFYPTTYFRTQLQEDFLQNSRDQKEHRLRMNGSFTQRKRHSIEFGLSARLRDDEGANNRFTNTVRDGVETSFVESQTDHDNRSYSVGGNINYRQNMNKLGSIQLLADLSHGKTDNTSVRIDSTYSGGLSTYDVLDMDGKRPNTFVMTNLYYSHPKLKGVYFRSSLNYTDEESERLYVNRFTHEVDSLRSENISKRTVRFQNSLDYYRTLTPNQSLRLEMRYELVKLMQDETFPVSWTERSTFHLFNPLLSYEIRKGRTSFNLRLDAGNISIPLNLADFSPRLNINNQMFVRAGNPNLKVPNRYGFSARLTLPNNLQYSFRGVYVKNGIVLSNTYYPEDTYLDEYDYHILGGAMLERPVNSDYWDLTTGLNYSKMFGFICNLKTALEYKFSNPEATYNGRMGRVKDQSGSFNLELFSNFSTSFFLTLRNRLVLDRYESADGFTNKGISNKTDFSVEWDITYRFFIKSRYIYTHRHSTMLERDINEQVLNATVGVKLFSNHRGKLTFNAFDILNDQSNILNSANDIYVQTTYKPLNTSYFTVSFEYRFSNQ